MKDRQIKIVDLNCQEYEEYLDFYITLQTDDLTIKDFLKIFSLEFVSTRVMETIEDYEKYINGLSLKYLDKVGEYYSVEIEKSYHKEPQSMYCENDRQILEYDSDKDIFVFHEYIEKNHMTRGGIKLIEEFKEGIEPITTTTDEYYLINILLGLRNFWH